MAFVNEAIPEQDKQKVNALVNYQTISAIGRGVHEFENPVWWTIDRERGVYLIDLGGGGGQMTSGGCHTQFWSLASMWCFSTWLAKVQATT